MSTVNYRDTKERVGEFPFFRGQKYQRSALVRKAADRSRPPVKGTLNCFKRKGILFNVIVKLFKGCCCDLIPARN